MKKEIHPADYQLTVFKDSTTGDQWLVKSCAKSKETVKFSDGNEYPLVLVHVSSKSHPFFTGENKVLDVEGRVDKFKKRQEAASAAKKAQQEKAAALKNKSSSKKESSKVEVEAEQSAVEESAAK